MSDPTLTDITKSHLSIEHFKQQWTRYFDNVPLITYTFKQHFAERWLRIHSLPNAKRYPDSESEWQVLLARQNQLLDELIGRNQPLYVVSGYYASTREPSSLSEQLHTSLNFKKWHSLPIIALCDGEPLNQALSEPPISDILYYHARVSAQTWQPSIFEPLLRAIAQDDCRAFFVSFGNYEFAEPVIIAPYDGGVDLIFANRQIRDSYKIKYQAWLSEREDGL